jgi:hypothetical protein
MEGVSLHDPDLDRLTGLYHDNGGRYWVLERGGQVVGGVGMAPLAAPGTSTPEAAPDAGTAGNRAPVAGSVVISLIVPSVFNQVSPAANSWNTQSGPFGPSICATLPSVGGGTSEVGTPLRATCM